MSSARPTQAAGLGGPLWYGASGDLCRGYTEVELCPGPFHYRSTTQQLATRRGYVSRLVRAFRPPVPARLVAPGGQYLQPTLSLRCVSVAHIRVQEAGVPLLIAPNLPERHL